MSRVTQKRVKVLHNGPIKAKGWVYGPILNPYMESTKIIFAMLKDGIRVIEVLNNGSTLVLNATNFDLDNNKNLSSDDELGDDDLFQPLSEVNREVRSNQPQTLSIGNVDETVVDKTEIATEEILEPVATVEEAPVINVVESKKDKKKNHKNK